MLSDFTKADKIYIACGYTDLRRGIDGLAGIVEQQFQLDPFSNSLFLFCGRRCDRIMTGYIDALEFQKPNVEGILRNNLHDMPSQVGLVMGSDCHEWVEYSDHDKNSRNKSFVHSRANILPTFKGLIMAVTFRPHPLIHRFRYPEKSVGTAKLPPPPPQVPTIWDKKEKPAIVLIAGFSFFKKYIMIFGLNRKKNLLSLISKARKNLLINCLSELST